MCIVCKCMSSQVHENDNKISSLHLWEAPLKVFGSIAQNLTENVK